MTKHVIPATRVNLISSRDASALQTPPNDADSQSPSSTYTLTPDSQNSEILRMADALSQLTQGCLRRITEGGTEENPIVQCVQIKPMNSQNAAERYRVVMSDSINFMQGMLGQRECISMVWRRPLSNMHSQNKISSSTRTSSRKVASAASPSSNRIT